MKNLLFIIIITQSFIGYSQFSHWDSIKANTHVDVMFPNEYENPYTQPLSVMGWEDGINITRDGLNLYCSYWPVDFLAFMEDTIYAPDYYFDPFKRGPEFGIDVDSNPVNPGHPWLHFDILYAHRNSLLESFVTWLHSNIGNSTHPNGAVFGEGGISVVMNQNNNIDNEIFTKKLIKE
jgi:hypothetical protein